MKSEPLVRLQLLVGHAEAARRQPEATFLLDHLEMGVLERSDIAINRAQVPAIPVGDRLDRQSPTGVGQDARELEQPNDLNVAGHDTPCPESAGDCATAVQIRPSDILSHSRRVCRSI